MEDRKLNPCYEYCYLRWGRQYVPSECDTTCEFAAAVVENKKSDLDRFIEILNKQKGLEYKVLSAEVNSGPGTIVITQYNKNEIWFSFNDEGESV